MRKTFTRKATEADARNLAAKLIGPDRIEVSAVTGMEPEVILPVAVPLSAEAYASGFEATPGEVELIWGVEPITHPGDLRVGQVWMLSSPAIYQFPQVFAKHVKDGWEDLHSRYDVLTNFTYAENHGHHKLIKWLGGKFIRQVDEFGVAQLPFIEFVSVRTPCAR